MKWQIVLAIAGGSGGVLVIILLFIIVIMCAKRRRRESDEWVIKHPFTGGILRGFCHRTESDLFFYFFLLILKAGHLRCYIWFVTLQSFWVLVFTCKDVPYNGYFLRLEIFAIWAPKRSILIFAFLIFAISFNRKKWLIDNYFHTWIWLSSAVIKYF